MSEALRLEGIQKAYNKGKSSEVAVLKGASLTLNMGEIVALVAPSGAGKSTLLHIAGLLETADAGRVFIGGEEVGQKSDDRRTALRRDKIGFIYQFHHLLPEFTAVENVALPQRATGKSGAEAAKRAADLLSTVGLDHRLTHRPAELSGGEQQRVAFCRALANQPEVLLADEPTGNLDPATSDTVFEAMTGIVRTTGLAALIATHNLDLAARMDRVLYLRDGQLGDTA